MRIICLQENLKEGLIILERATSKNQNLPLLHNISLKTEVGIIKAFATDLEIGVEVCIPCKVEKQGEVVIPIKTILQFIQNLPNTKITIEIKNKTVFIETEYNTITIPCFNTNEFPLTPKVKSKNTIEINNALILKNTLQQVLNSTAVSYSLPEITGILCVVKENTFTFVATDSFRLAEKTIFKEKNYKTNIITIFILPQKTAQELTRIITTNNPITITIDENQVMFSLQNITIISRLINGKYPNYEQIIPKTHKTNISMQKNEFLNQIKLASFFSSKINDVKITVKKNKKSIEIDTSDQVKGEFHASIPSLEINGEDAEVIFNFKYLIDGLNNLTEDEFVFEINGPAAPSLFKTKTGDYRYIIMPIKT